MRTKVILCAASLAAGALSSMAQVYSQNIVGYTVNTGPGFHFLSSPVDPSIGTTGTFDYTGFATNVLPNVGAQGGTYSGPYDSDSVALWSGVSFSTYYFDSETTDTTTGFTDQASNPLPCPTLGPGVGWLFQNANGIASITFVGQVRRTNDTHYASGIKMAYPAAAHPYAVGSLEPLGDPVIGVNDLVTNNLLGGVSTALGMKNPGAQGGTYSGPLDSSYVEKLITVGSGQAHGYDVSYFDSETTDTTTGFTDQASNPKAEPVIGLAHGFFFVSQTGTGYTWDQTSLAP